MKNQYYRAGIAFLMLGALITGCDKANNPLTATVTASATEDAAYAIAGAMGDSTGGAAESYADLLTLQSTGKLQSTNTLGKGVTETVSSDSGTYDAANGWWTVTISKMRSNGRVTANIERQYQYRFWKNDAEWQQYYVVNGDTAIKMEFKIVSGSGYFKNPMVTHQLNELHGAWLATNINKDTVTITLQEQYFRSGVDSIVTHNVTRTLNDTLTITSATITALRYKPSPLRLYALWRLNFPRTISGTVSGHYSATITKQREDFYNETRIDKDFAVTFSGGSGHISIGGQVGFHCNIESGERDDNHGDDDNGGDHH